MTMTLTEFDELSQQNDLRIERFEKRLLESGYTLVDDASIAPMTDAQFQEMLDRADDNTVSMSAGRRSL